MSKCTAKEALDAISYWLGYYEKASILYSTTRDKDAFDKNKGSNNYTYPGMLCGVNGQPWCAATVSTAIHDACGYSKEDAKAVMHGVWPYVNCAQLWDAAPDTHRFWSYYQRYTLGKGNRTNYVPVKGDVIVFSDNGRSRDHTGMVYDVGNGYVYTIEGNSANMCRKRSYPLTSSYIYGYVKPLYAESDEEYDGDRDQYGSVVYEDIGLHLLSKGCAGDEVKTIQRILYGANITDDSGNAIARDGEFGKRTEQAVKKMQKKLGISQDGKVGRDTWKGALTKLG